MATRSGLSVLLFVHGLITLVAGIMLAVAPGLIPSVVGMRLDPRADLVAYLLAGAEIGFAGLSLGGSRLEDPRALRLIATELHRLPRFERSARDRGLCQRGERGHPGQCRCTHPRLPALCRALEARRIHADRAAS